MTIFLKILEFLIFVKLFLFWLWLWQLKEYHIGRFRAHFETQRIRKIASSLWRLKYPKFTKKIIIIFLAGALLAIWRPFFFSGVLLIIFAPVFSSLLILSFQIPTVLWRKTIISKARKKREKFENLTVIGITGSYGKTSTKEFLYTILAEKFGEDKVLKTKEHQNSEVGISRCVLNDLKPEHRIFICEMAAYDKGGIKLLCEIVKPKIGIITGINEQHLATFGSMENLISAEGGKELIESLPEDGTVFLNGKNEFCRKIYQEIEKKKFLYGEKAGLLLENIDGAKIAARELGLTEDEILRGCQKVKNFLPGIEIKKGINGVNIIDAIYSSNPDSVISHLNYLKTYKGRKAIIMPCLIELGKAAKEVHFRIGAKIGEVCDFAIITTGDYFRELQNGASSNGMSPEKIIFSGNSELIFEKIKTFQGSEDVILLEGRSPKNIIKNLTI